MLSAVTASAQSYPMSDYDHSNLELNLRWIVQRHKVAEKAQSHLASRVGVFADAGVWHLGARSIVDALEQVDVPCVVLDKSDLNSESLGRFEIIVFPGGWAPLQWSAAGEDGLAAVRSFTENGGRCIGICAGAYLLSKKVTYDGESFDYPLGLFDGEAVGPVKGLSPFPQPGKTSLRVTEAGLARGLGELDKHEAYYSGGPYFKDGSNVHVLAEYADGTAAMISRPVGKGEIVLVGAHIERPAGSSDDNAPPPLWAGEVLKTLLSGPKQMDTVQPSR